MTNPNDRKYTTDHEWVTVDGDTATLGITDYAQDALGDVVFVELPEIDTPTVAGESFCEIESTKSVAEVVAPIDGRVVEVNAAVNDDPAVMNEDPYGAGWICRIEMADAASLDHLMDAAAYEAFIAD